VVGQRVPEYGCEADHSAECHQNHEKLQAYAQAIAQLLALGGGNRETSLLIEVFDLELDQSALFREVLAGGTAELGIVMRSLKGERYRRCIGTAYRCVAFR
jgi:hypothetical protein